MSTSRINWKEVGIFYLVAVLLSAPFRLGVIKLNELMPLPYGFNVFYAVFKAIGPVMGFVTVYYLIKSKTRQTNTLTGNNRIKSLLAVFVIPIMMTLLGVKNNAGLNIHYFGFISSLAFTVYALFEEYGWRGYLQNALEPLSLRIRVLLIATLWYIWHLNFLLPSMTIQQHAIHFVSLVAGTWGLLQITNKTHSLLFATAIHLSFNLLTEVNGEFNKRLIVLAVAVLVWLILLRAKKPSLQNA